MKNFNQLTPAETERLAILAEECAEAIHVIGKILRHGYGSRHPGGGPTNRTMLECELGDIQFAKDLMVTGNDIDLDRIANAALDKELRIERYLHHNRHLIEVRKNPELLEGGE